MILTYGTRGDVEPFVALGVGLIQVGYSVRLVGPQAFSALVEDHGLEFQAIQSNSEELGQVLADRAGRNWIKMITRMTEHVFPLAKSALGVIEHASIGADLIIHSFLMTDAGHIMAKKLGIPDISAQFFPVFLPTKEFPAVGLPDLPFGKLYRFGSHALSTATFRYGPRIIYKRLKKSAPELPDLAPWLLTGPVEDQTPILFAYSRFVLPFPENWPKNAHITGYWQLPVPSGWEPPADLVNFLENGTPPIYFSPGSMQSKKASQLLNLVIRAAVKSGVRVVLGVSPAEIPEEMQGENVICANDVPHAWLFPRVAFILHHGGAGTCGSALSAGVPNTAIPYSVDQFFWAKRLAQAGVGPSAPDARHLTEKDLTELIQDGIGNPKYRGKAINLVQKIRQEDGLSNALDIIQKSCRS
ncbi:MAG: glycosyltransferase family 1 protein [Anaerolineaceae bacterium]|nr:glycosyltransferase family 1 protein [Anaerolineaceae bacterium]